jgi:hypothetical protein
MTARRDWFNRAALSRNGAIKPIAPRLLSHHFQQPWPCHHPCCSESPAEIDETAGLSFPKFFCHFDFLALLFPQQILVKRRKSSVNRQ